MSAAAAERDFARHRLVALIVTAASLALMAPARDLGIGAQLAILAGGLALTGVPHGAVDHVRMAPRFRRRFGRSWLLVFLFAYVGVATAVAAIWLAWPAPSLMLFLALSLHHFGSGDAEDGLGAVVHGSVPILAPCAAHPDAVAELFALLTATQVSAWQAFLRDVRPILVLVMVGLVALRWARRRGSFAEALELLAIAAAGLALPPLLSFTLYFCVWHAPRHIVLVARELRPGPLAGSLAAFARAALPMTLATVALGALALGWMPAGQQPTERLLQVVFVGLAALTVPHLLVTDAMRRSAAAVVHAMPAAVR